MHSAPQRPLRAAFTLIELLIVIGIIAILIGLALPGIQAARESAKNAQCQSNLRQLGIAAMQYHDVHNYYPPYRFEDPNVVNNYGVVRPRWQWIMASFMGGWAQNPDAITAAKNSPTWDGDTTYTFSVPLDNKILVCPSMGTLNSNYQSIRNGSYGYNFGYLGNSRNMTDGDLTTPTINYPVASVKTPSRTVAFADSRGGSTPHGGHSMTLDPPHFVPRSDGKSVNSPYWNQPPFNITDPKKMPINVNPYGPDEGTPDIAVPFSPAEGRHNGNANVVFLDGHVESLSLDALGYAMLNGVPQLQTLNTTTTPPTVNPLTGASNALWNGRGLDESSPNFAIDAP